MDLIKKIPSSSVALTITSPPYAMDKEYESGNTLDDFVAAHEALVPELVRITKDGGSICWQVGYHVKDGIVTPLDFLVYEAFRKFPELVLRNRIIWTFGHGLHCANRFSGRHETILWFSKGDKFSFNLDDVRIPQKYPGKRANRGPRKGEYSGNPKGKNPSDVWDIPNVKSNHVEKLDHPCQFPVGLAQRMIKALTTPGDLIFDPFSGVASSGVAALVENRRYIGAELNPKYAEIAETRLKEAVAGSVKLRPDVPVYVPTAGEAVAKRPAHFAAPLTE
ncbi:site-specific DNA-methyltransferase [Massilia sp. Root335]|uniref:DNA-methyltransferase n=1 Tax=Massilia sp. Root335 TaxID=1736517 RepID=UPI0019109628|nr:site-specific DNA-methyltransferase [Massilia sp. Root335]